MPSFQEILSKLYLSYESMEQDIQETAKNDGFMVIKKNTDHNDENVVLKGTFKCYKSGVSGARKAKGTAKTDCQFNVHFRRHQATGSYSFTDTHDLAHNHPMDPASTTMSALARRFVPNQVNLIDILHSLSVPVAVIVEELRRDTNAVVQKKMSITICSDQCGKGLTGKCRFWICFQHLTEMKTSSIKSALTARNC